MVFTRAVLGLVLALPLPAAAYESIESDTINIPDQGTQGNISAVLDGRSGNTVREDYTVGGRLDYRARETDMFVLTEHSHATAFTDPQREVEDSTWAHAGFRDEFQHGLAAEAFVDARKDDFERLDLRTQLGAGTRFTLDYTPDVRAVYAGIGILHEWEDQAQTSEHYWRLNSYVTYKRQLNEQLRVLFNAAYQPRLGESDDYLLSTEAALLVKLAEHVDARIGVRWLFDSAAPTGIKSDDTRYVTAISLHF
ncbi:MAG TPA: DUF481 domain-containing protein [Moraxellaceae bacterium]|nr:DUF481 domain-containing protein [Moraxellaceae bacterium]